MFDERPRNCFGIFAVISDHYGDGGIVSSHAVDEILKLIITQESFGSYGNQGTNVVLCREGRPLEETDIMEFQKHKAYCSVDKQWND